MAISGNRVVIGCPNDEPGPGNTMRGSATVFVRNNQTQTWSFEGPQLIPSSPLNGDHFGWSVDIDNSQPRVVAGAPQFGASLAGRALVFERISGWQQVAELLVPPGEDLDAGDAFGSAVAVDGNTIVVGAQAHDHGQQSFETGGAYVFVLGGGGWAFDAELSDPTVLDSDHFGWSVDLDGDIAVIGAKDADRISAPPNQVLLTDCGAVYVFSRASGSWVLQEQLQAPDREAFDRFGQTVRIDGNRIVVGTAAAESAYLFEFDWSVWSDNVTILSSGNARADAEFGCSADISGDLVVVGSPNDDGCNVVEPEPTVAHPNYERSGAAYFFAPFSDVHEFYGTPETTTNTGCDQSFLSLVGEPSATSAASFGIRAEDATFSTAASSGFCVLSGTLYWGVTGRQSLPLGGGTILVNNHFEAVPAVLPIVSSSCPPANLCGWVLGIDFNQVIQSGNYPTELFIGQKVNAQWILHNQFDGDGFETTNAVEFVVGP